MEKPYVVGMDIGGTNTVFGIVNTRGEILHKGSIKTCEYEDINVYMDTLYNELSKLINKAGGFYQIKGIGIGAPNANYYTGNIEHAANLKWKGIIELSKMVTEKFGLRSVLTNDANAAAMGEMTYGSARGMKNFIMITLGTGVGGGIVIDGKILYGHDGFAGELGHTISVRENGRQCGCGRNGCLETYCSAKGVANSAREILKSTDKESILRNIPLEDITSKDVYNAALEGDIIAKEIFIYTGRILGEAMANFVSFSAPEAIILFGGLTKSWDFMIDSIEEHMNKNLLQIWQGKIKILPSTLRESDAAILGASALAWEL